jgi:hypothetical protein
VRVDSYKVQRICVRVVQLVDFVEEESSYSFAVPLSEQSVSRIFKGVSILGDQFERGGERRGQKPIREGELPVFIGGGVSVESNSDWNSSSPFGVGMQQSSAQVDVPFE